MDSGTTLGDVVTAGNGTGCTGSQSGSFTSELHGRRRRVRYHAAGSPASNS